MNRELQLMVQLQKLALAIHELSAQREAGPRRLNELEERFQTTVADIGAARLRHETLESERRQLEGEIQEFEQKLEKCHQQLMSVTNAREYSAALNEIDAAKQARERAEEGILVRQVEEDELAEAVQEADVHIANAREEADVEKARIEKELSEVDSKIEALSAERAEVEAELDPQQVSLFKRVFAARGGIAMAPVVGMACSACNLRLRPQVFNEVRRGEKLVPCDNCRRFLYVEPDSEAADPDAEPPTEAAVGTTVSEGPGGGESSSSSDPSSGESTIVTDAADASRSGTDVQVS